MEESDWCRESRIQWPAGQHVEKIHTKTGQVHSGNIRNDFDNCNDKLQVVLMHLWRGYLDWKICSFSVIIKHQNIMEAQLGVSLSIKHLQCFRWLIIWGLILICSFTEIMARQWMPSPLGSTAYDSRVIIPRPDWKTEQGSKKGLVHVHDSKRVYMYISESNHIWSWLSPLFLLCL